MSWPLSTRVEVEWRDSMSRGGWDTPEAHREKRGVGPIRSIGFLLQADKDIVQLAQSMSAVAGHVSDTITIPRENVVKMRTVRGMK
jgi:hypothetical protein